jgi:hypothetical protein
MEMRLEMMMKRRMKKAGFSHFIAFLNHLFATCSSLSSKITFCADISYAWFVVLFPKACVNFLIFENIFAFGLFL